MAAPHSPWTIDAPAHAAYRGQLWCFPFAGGGATAFHGWGEALAPVAACRAVQWPGRENRLREPPLSDWHDLLDALVGALAPEVHPPYALFGHSLGGLVAFEFARRMAFEGYPPPAALFVGGCRPPEQSRRRSPPLHTLAAPQFLAELEKLGGMPAAVLESQELRDVVMPALRADFKLVETYHCAAGPPLVGPIIAYGGEGDAEAPPAELASWARRTTGAFRQANFPGGHFFLRPQRLALLADLRAELERCW